MLPDLRNSKERTTLQILGPNIKRDFREIIIYLENMVAHVSFLGVTVILECNMAR